MNPTSIQNSGLSAAPETGLAKPALRRGRTPFTYPIAWFVLVIALAASGVGWFIARKHEELGARKRFDEEASLIVMTLTERMAIYQDVLHGGGGLFAASVSVERAEWKAYVESVSVEKRYPGINGVGFIANVPREKLDDFLKITREDKSPNFIVPNLGTNMDLLVVKYVEPEPRYRAMLGVDFGTDPERRAVAERARDANAVMISGRINLREPGAEPQSGFLMLLPIYRHGASTATVTERQAGTEGWVFARFVTRQLMQGVLGDKVQMLRCEVFDATNTGTNQLLFATEAAPTTDAADFVPRFASEIPIKMGGRDWMLRFSTRPAFDATIARWPGILVGTAGVCISVLLFGIAWSLSSTRERAQVMATDMTTAFREANSRLENEISERQQAERRTAMQYAVTRLLAEGMTLTEVAPRILQAICENLGWELGALWERDPQTSRLHCVEIWHVPRLDRTEFESATRERTFGVGEGLPGRVWSTGKPAWIADVHHDQNFPRAAVAAKAGLHGALGFPVLLHNEFLGVIEFFSHAILEPDAELIDLMAATGSQVGQFIERKRSETALKDSEILYHSLVESLPLQIVRRDLQGRITFANQRFCSEAGKTTADILGRTGEDLYPPALVAQRQQSDALVLAQGITVETIEEHPPVDGRKRFIQVIKAPVRDAAGKVAGLLDICWDVTDKRHAEEELEHERFLLRTLMDNLPDRIYFKDEHSRFLRNSRAHYEFFGLKHAAEAIGKSDFDFFSEEHARQAYEDEQALMHSGQPVTKEEKETWPDGSVTWVLTTKMPLRDEDGRTIGTFGISRDITARRRAEEALKVAKEAAEEASRAKSQFLASMSHELRTPLNSVIGFANILLKNRAGNLSPSDLTFLDRIAANGKHLLALINEILDLSKIEARKVELQITPVALDQLIRETVAQQEGLVRDKPVQLVADLPTRVVPYPTDADKFRQIVINLIGNALKFTERGSVTVRLVTDPVNHHPLRVEVIDTGIGISQDKLGIIFQAFQQAEAGTARKYGGTGLGLTISQALCQLMGHRIQVTSEVGRGSTFSVMLKPMPETAPDLTAVVAPTAPLPPTTGGPLALQGKRVLVIDDELDSRTLLSHVITECGCQVMAASSGAQGLQIAREFRPDLITLDLMMPSMDGWQVVRAIKADPQLCLIPVVVVSVVANENRGHVLGAVDVLQKPVVREELLAVLHRNLLVAKPKILVVDDDEDARRVMASQLEGEVAEIRTAANGREALTVLEQFTPDLTLLDLMMPVMDGMAFLDAIRRDLRYQRLPVVVITARELTAQEREQLRFDALRVLNKSEAFAGELKRLLAELLQVGSRASGAKSA